MPYDVDWSEDAIDQLADILRANRMLRRFLVDDANRVDEVLVIDPRGVGSRVDEELWVSQIGRLSISYAIDDDLERVDILAVKLSL